MPRQKPITKEIELRLPKLYAQENEKDPIVHLKFFQPWGGWTWYITEGQKEDGDFRMFGLVVGHETELGYVSLNELMAIKGPAGLYIERDAHFSPKPLSECRAKHA